MYPTTYIIRVFVFRGFVLVVPCGTRLFGVLTAIKEAAQGGLPCYLVVYLGV